MDAHGEHEPVGVNVQMAFATRQTLRPVVAALKTSRPSVGLDALLVVERPRWWGLGGALPSRALPLVAGRALWYTASGLLADDS